MNSRKKRRLKAKRTPWVESRYSKRRRPDRWFCVSEEAPWTELHVQYPLSQLNEYCVDMKACTSGKGDEGSLPLFLKNFDFEKFQKEIETHQAQVSAFIDQKLQYETAWKACNTLADDQI